MPVRAMVPPGEDQGLYPPGATLRGGPVIGRFDGMEERKKKKKATMLINGVQWPHAVCLTFHPVSLFDCAIARHKGCVCG